MKKLWVAIGLSMIVACNSLQAPSKAPQQVIYTNDAWQKHYNEKLMLCYQRMETMEAVDYCLILLGVYI